ncbi:PTS sugar transporter subunit IIA [Caproiciproducens faecalis]|uniref:PTS glucose transporter subunit IIA n=1 Tax=Caproiciproducens faecalis TaxID=2820301 RepID=A0ABS7DK39_9FIRM|nr:PTS glucose transporter subunit IIA [Caproiciproducens faecalis]MBW7571583.1 PTS glucose transporter subunit IIA [Caproiciproducens faecalis]
MQLFGKNKKRTILAQQTGKVILLAEVPDPVFANKILGDGIAIQPTANEVYSPVSGTIAQIAHTLHAIGIESDDGIEVLVHLGIDTVKLNGEGFTCHVEVGQHVAAGEKVMDMDIQAITEKGYSTISPCIITNLDTVKSFECKQGNVSGGKSVVMNFVKQ